MTMRHLAFAAVLGCCALANCKPALAAEGPDDRADAMTPRFGNTLRVITPNGREIALYFSPDRSFSGRFDNEITTGGKWTLQADGQLCLTWSTPPGGYPNPTCTPIARHEVGETWREGALLVRLEKGVAP